MSTGIEVISPYEDRRLRNKTMRLSVIEGMFAVFIFGLQQVFYVPYLNAMGASKFQIGIGFCMLNLMAGVIQIWTPGLLVRLKSYKKLISWGAFSHGLFMVPFGLMWWLVPRSPIWPAIAVITLSSLAMGLGMAAWSDWMSYIVPRRRRGRYFANRTRILTVLQLILAITASKILDKFPGHTLGLFAIIWMVCFVTRGISAFCLAHYYEPPAIHQTARKKSSLAAFIRQQFSTSFGRFVLGMSLVNFGWNFALPFYAIYMLNDLKMTYIQYTVLLLTPAVTNIVGLNIWGRVCDRFGHVIPMRLSGIMLAIPPLLWVVTRDYRLLMISQVVSGVAYGGFLLTTFNYSISSLDSADRANNISYMNVINLTFASLGSFFGGLLGPYLPKVSSYQLHSIFMFSGIVCLVSGMLFQKIMLDRKAKTRLNTIERFFFDPGLSFNIDFSRAIFGRQKRGV